MRTPKLARSDRRFKTTSFEARVAPELARLEEVVSAAAEGDAPVVVGPFSSEVGFELLYWIPLIRWAVDRFPSLRGRLVIVSRGGTSHWCSGIDARYMDLFEVSTPKELVRRRESLKQREVTAYERELYDRVKDRIGAAEVQVLHPQVLFNLYYRVLKIERHGFARSVKRVGERIEGLGALFEPLPDPDPAVLPGLLPERYAAVRFYFRPSFPDTAENREFARRVVDAITERMPVVLLNNRMELDDHGDLAVDGEHVRTVHERMRPEDNLHVQTVAISRATVFVGTYGGLAYLAPLLRVPSLAFSSHPEHTHPWHLELAQRVYGDSRFGSLVVLRPEDVGLVDLVAAAMPFDALARSPGRPR